MSFGKERLLELLSIQKDWIYYEGRWFNVKIHNGDIFCDGYLIDDNWTSEKKEILDPIENRFEILDL